MSDSLDSFFNKTSVLINTINPFLRVLYKLKILELKKDGGIIANTARLGEIHGINIE